MSNTFSYTSNFSFDVISNKIQSFKILTLFILIAIQNLEAYGSKAKYWYLDTVITFLLVILIYIMLFKLMQFRTDTDTYKYPKYYWIFHYSVIELPYIFVYGLIMYLVNVRLGIGTIILILSLDLIFSSLKKRINRDRQIKIEFVGSNIGIHQSLRIPLIKDEDLQILSEDNQIKAMLAVVKLQEESMLNRRLLIKPFDIEDGLIQDPPATSQFYLYMFSKQSENIGLLSAVFDNLKEFEKFQNNLSDVITLDFVDYSKPILENTSGIITI